MAVMELASSAARIVGRAGSKNQVIQPRRFAVSSSL